MNTPIRARIAASAAATAMAMGALVGVSPQAAAAAEPFLFAYTFNNHLKLGGGNYTIGGRVYVVVKFNNGVRQVRTRCDGAAARHHAWRRGLRRDNRRGTLRPWQQRVRPGL